MGFIQSLITGMYFGTNEGLEIELDGSKIRYDDLDYKFFRRARYFDKRLKVFKTYGTVYQDIKEFYYNKTFKKRCFFASISS